MERAPLSAKVEVFNAKTDPPIQLKSDGSYLYFDALMLTGHEVRRLYVWNNHHVSTEELITYCDYHNDHCRYSNSIGKNLNLITGPDGDMKFLCSFHWLQNAFRRFLVDGTELSNCTDIMLRDN